MVIGRFNPFDTGVLSDETSALTDSFQDGLSGTYIYKTCRLQRMESPWVLTSGNFAKIDKWREDAMNTQKRDACLWKNKKTALKLVFQHLETLYKINFKL
jgi:tRNA (guanine-N1)-methyltransferase